MKPYYETRLGRLYHGNVLDVLPQLGPESVQCCVTSPPYWGLRDYGVDGQFGLEPTPEEYTEKMVSVFRGVNSVLSGDGTLWLNLGDSYAGSCRGADAKYANKKLEEDSLKIKPDWDISGLKPKDLCGIPWRVAFALQSDGWYLRQDIIWVKPNPMPESVKDRCTKSHEYIFLMSKNGKYYYDADAVKEEAVFPNDNRGNRTDNRRGTECNSMNGKTGTHRNKRSVWAIPTHPYPEAHFATFPTALIEPCIFAGSREGDIVLDPFFGAGTTGLVCEKYGRKWIGIELNEQYAEIAAKRIESEASQLKLWG